MPELIESRIPCGTVVNIGSNPTPVVLKEYDRETGKVITQHTAPKGSVILSKVYLSTIRLIAASVAAFVLLSSAAPHATAQINGSPMPFVKPQFFDNGGKPAADYKLCTYSAGTNNPIRTYTTSALSVPNPNPLVLDSAGRAAIFWPNVAIKVALLTEKSTTTDCLTGSMVTVWSQDNIETDSALIKALLAGSTGNTGAGLIGFNQSANYPAGTVGIKLQQFINVSDAPYNATVGSTDNSPAIAAAISALGVNGGTISFPCGDFKGRFTFPQYPKTVIVEGQGPCTILEEPSADSGIVSSSAIVANYTSGRNVLRNVALKPNNSSSTSKAIDMRGQNDGIYQGLEFVPASNGTGHFGWGFYCSTATALFTACYGNTVDHVKAFVQVGPTVLVETEQFAALNTFSNFHIVDLTATTDIFYLNSPNNKLVNTDIEGNPLATVLHNGGGGNHVEGTSDWEGNNREILGDSNGYELVVEGGAIGPGVTSMITCSTLQSGWDFRNVSGITLASQLVGCVNAKVTVGSSIDGLAPKSIIGGISTNTVTAATGASITEVPLGSGGLPADTYTYNATVTTAGGASLPFTFGPITISNHSGLQLFFSGNATVPYYTIYGRKCPTSGTCKVLITVPSEGNAGGGLWFDDGTLSPSGNSPITTRDSTGDLNVNGNPGGDGATASNIYLSGGINHGTETGANNALVWTPQNGPAMAFQAYPYADGFTICMTTAHSLQIGTNSLNSVLVKKGTDVTSDLTAPVAAGNAACFIYNKAANAGSGIFQYQGQ